MKKNNLNSKDLLLSFLYSPGISSKPNEAIVGRTKLTKMMFLFEKEIYIQFFKDSLQIKLPDFSPYYFGPFSKQLFEDLAFFESIGMIETQETNIPLSDVDKIENASVFDIESEESAGMSFEDEKEKFELQYRLTECGETYIKNEVWDNYSKKQQEVLKMFKAQINRISLDSLLKYVYNKYPETTKNSIIINKYRNG